MIEHVTSTGVFIHEIVGRLTANPLDFKDQRRYKHSTDWFGYCEACGDLKIVNFPFDWRLEPEGELWREQGLHCRACQGEVWWIKEELYDAIFALDVPKYYLARDYTGPPCIGLFEDRLYLRVVSWCVWGKEQMFDDGEHWNYMICPECVRHVGSLIIGTLIKVYGMPKHAAIEVELFLLARD